MRADDDTDPGPGGHGATNGTDPASHESVADVRGAFDDVGRAAESVRELAWIRWRRLNVQIRRGLFLAVGGAWLALIAFVASIAATIRLVNGAAGGIASAAGRAWVGDLACGVLVLTLIAGGAWLCYRAVAHRSAGETQRRLARHGRQGEDP